MSELEKTFEGATLEGPPAANEAGALLVPALTVAAHPDPGRIGDQLRLSPLALGRSVALNRLEPELTGPSGRPTGPLRDPYLSRRPVVFERGPGGGVRIDASGSGTPVAVDGEVVGGTADISAETLAGPGAVLELADRVVLVLHAALPVAAGEATKHGLVGVSRHIAGLWREIDRVGPESISVLLRGESGTGKELVARAIHLRSPRARAPYVAVNMAAIPPTTAASELFGHARGAFTGAAESHFGFFGQADGGSLFLDEVGETPSDVQPLLLRALETGEVQPVGGRRTGRVDVRLIAATDADLERAISEGQFRTALLHRLAGYAVLVPPLRSRREDIGLLLRHFLAEQLAETGDGALLKPRDPRDPPWIPAPLVARLVRYSWPGNVRQLRNVARRLLVASRDLPQLQMPPGAEQLMRAAEAPPRPAPAESAAFDTGSRRAPTDLDAIDDQTLLGALRQHRWKVGATARALGISKNSLYKLMDRSSAIRKARDLTAEEILRCAREADSDLDQMSEQLCVSRRGLQLRITELELDLSAR